MDEKLGNQITIVFEQDSAGYHFNVRFRCFVSI